MLCYMFELKDVAWNLLRNILQYGPEIGNEFRTIKEKDHYK